MSKALLSVGCSVVIGDGGDGGGHRHHHLSSGGDVCICFIPMKLVFLLPFMWLHSNLDATT